MKNPDIDKLLELANRPADPLENLNEAQRWVISAGIKEGTDKVISFVVWDAYCRWTKKPIAKNKFFEYFNAIFTRYKNSGTLFYRLDGSKFDLSLDHYFALRKRMRNARKAKHRDKTSKNKVPRTGPVG